MATEKQEVYIFYKIKSHSSDLISKNLLYKNGEWVGDIFSRNLTKSNLDNKEVNHLIKLLETMEDFEEEETKEIKAVYQFLKDKKIID